MLTLKNFLNARTNYLHRWTQAAIITVFLMAFSTMATSQVLVAEKVQGKQASIEYELVDLHIKTLSSDEFKGRGSLSPDVRMTEDYVAKQFKAAGLKEFEQFPGYRHEFEAALRGRRGRGNQGNADTQTPGIMIANIVGYLEGHDPELKDEYIIYGAHHDHLGIRGEGGEGIDNIWNGAEDNGTGTVAVMMLAKYFAAKNDNKRSIIFMTFAAEEAGMIGSNRMVTDLPVPKEKVAALINFEMIGKPSKEGVPSAFLTGWDRSDLGPIMQESLGEDEFKLVEGPEIAKNFFNASDNAPFARAGIVAHTVGGILSTSDEHYHKASDEYETISVKNMVTVIKGTAKASRTLISGEKTPKYIER